MTHSKSAPPADFRVAGQLAAAAQEVPAWVSDISFGVPAMDQLHHDLFSALDALSCSNDNDFGSRYAAFVAKMEQAFREEEEWMDALDYSSFISHQEQHARVLGVLHHAHALIMDGDLAIGRQVVEDLLPQWLSFHISTMDTPLALAVQRARNEHAFSLQPT